MAFTDHLLCARTLSLLSMILRFPHFIDRYKGSEWLGNLDKHG